MRLLLEEDLAGARTMDELAGRTIETFSSLRADDRQVWLVSGAISADGEDKIPENIDRLVKQRNEYMRCLGKHAITFAAPFIFTSEVYERLRIFEMERAEREEMFRSWWRRILCSGQVDGVVFAPAFERSPGSRDEQVTAQALGLALVYI